MDKLWKNGGTFFFRMASPWKMKVDAIIDLCDGTETWKWEDSK
jgi:hypothetical protein